MSANLLMVNHDTQGIIEEILAARPVTGPGGGASAGPGSPDPPGWSSNVTSAMTGRWSEPLPTPTPLRTAVNPGPT